MASYSHLIWLVSDQIMLITTHGIKISAERLPYLPKDAARRRPIYRYRAVPIDVVTGKKLKEHLTTIMQGEAKQDWLLSKAAQFIRQQMDGGYANAWENNIGVCTTDRWLKNRCLKIRNDNAKRDQDTAMRRRKRTKHVNVIQSVLRNALA